MTRKKEDYREFVPSKRVKGFYRASKSTDSLRKWARGNFDSTDENVSKAVITWMSNKGMV